MQGKAASVHFRLSIRRTETFYDITTREIKLFQNTYGRRLLKAAERRARVSFLTCNHVITLPSRSVPRRPIARYRTAAIKRRSVSCRTRSALSRGRCHSSPPVTMKFDLWFWSTNLCVFPSVSSLVERECDQLQTVMIVCAMCVSDSVVFERCTERMELATFGCNQNHYTSWC